MLNPTVTTPLYDKRYYTNLPQVRAWNAGQLFYDLGYLLNVSEEEADTDAQYIVFLLGTRDVREYSHIEFVEA